MSLLIRTLILFLVLLAQPWPMAHSFAADLATAESSPPTAPLAGQDAQAPPQASPAPAASGGTTGQAKSSVVGGEPGDATTVGAAATVSDTPPSTEIGTSADLTFTSPIPAGSTTAQVGAGFGYGNLNAGAPVTEGPINDQYLVSPGDEIIVSIWGRIVETMNLTVTAEGYIDLPDQGGRIITNGVTLQELKPKIVQALAQIRAAYINATDPAKSQAFVDVQLGKLRKLSVYVIGEVKQPGVYTVSPGVANVVNLLHNAGGVRPTGSLREIVIRHGNGATDSVDLYEYFLKSTFSYNKLHLAPGDSIMVPLKKKSATLKGEVRRPDQYELVGNEGLRELIEFAGGFSPDAYLKQSQIRRFEKNRGEVIMDVDLDEVTSQADDNLPLLDGDIITVAKNIQVRNNSVTISGNGITRPGTYEWRPGMKLADLITKAEGLREDAYLDRADLIRTEADFSKKLTVLTLADLYQPGEDGQFAFTNNPDKNIPLREMDELIIQSAYGMQGKDPQVTLEGHVKEPGLFPLAKGMNLYDLMFLRGGFQDDAFRKSTFLETAHIFRKVSGAIGQKIIPFNLGALLDRDPAANLPLEGDDFIRIYAYDELGKQQTVHIDGLVRKPGDFPLAEDLTLEDLLVLAGGLQPGTEKAEAIIARPDLEGNSRSVVAPISAEYTRLPIEQRTLLEAGDKISVIGLAGRNRHVTMEGHVTTPGQFVLTQNMTLYDLVSTRAGFQDPEFRKGAFMELAHLFRKVPGRIGTKIIDFSLQRLLDQDPAANMVLEEGDTIRIYAAANMRTEEYVRIDGLVKNPGKFHMAENLTVEDLILMAGGLMRDAFMYEAAISRTERNDQRDKTLADFDQVRSTIITVPISGQDFTKTPREQRTRLQPFDHVMMRPVSGWKRSSVAKITGEVTSPGVYTLETDNMTLSTLIQRAGGLTPKALAEGIVLERQGKIIDMEPNKEDFVKKDTRMADDPKASKEPTKTEEKAPPPPPVRGYERVIVNAAAALSDPGGPEDLILQNADKVYVPANPGIVEVRGAVKQPLILQHIAGRTLDDYIVLCGGYLNSADPANVAIFAANKMAITKQLHAGSGKARGKGKTQLTANNAGIPPGSVIEVPFQYESERMLTVQVKGAVAKPALIQHIEGAPLGYYLNLSGGFTEDADLDQISVLLPNGGLLAKNGNQDFNPVIPGGSLVMIPSRPQANPK